jgi:hypothetical protein
LPEILQDLLSALLALFRGQAGWQANGLGNVAELVEETALLCSIEPDRLQGGTKPRSPIMDD